MIYRIFENFSLEKQLFTIRLTTQFFYGILKLIISPRVIVSAYGADGRSELS